MLWRRAYREVWGGERKCEIQERRGTSRVKEPRALENALLRNSFMRGKKKRGSET